MPLLKVDRLFKSFRNDGNEIQVLKGASFEVNEGEVVSIMGPSGVGKTTILNIIGTLDIPDSGAVYFKGINPFTLPEKGVANFRNTRIGFVFQFHHLLPEFTALENVMIPQMIYGNDIKRARVQALEILNRVGLSDRINHKPSALSGGERQRVAVARALINNPIVILADEPTGNLDRANSEMLLNLILELNYRYKTTFIIATHNPYIADKSSRTLYLDDGVIRE